jgi:integrase
MLQAGLRVNEVAACRGDDLVLSREGMHLRVESPRGAIREVPLNETLARAVRDYLSVRPNTPEVDQLFVGQGGRPLSTRAIQRLIETYAAAANLKAVCAQHLRHTCAQRMLAETHDPELVAQWLGKRSVAGLEKFAREA